MEIVKENSNEPEKDYLVQIKNLENENLQLKDSNSSKEKLISDLQKNISELNQKIFLLEAKSNSKKDSEENLENAIMELNLFTNKNYITELEFKISQNSQINSLNNSFDIKKIEGMLNPIFKEFNMKMDGEESIKKFIDIIQEFKKNNSQILKKNEEYERIIENLKKQIQVIIQNNSGGGNSLFSFSNVKKGDIALFSRNYHFDGIFLK